MREESPLSLEKQGLAAIIWMDSPGEDRNTISIDILDDFYSLMEEIEESDEFRYCIIASKKEGFMAGADIKRFLEMKPGEAGEIARKGHDFLRRIEKSKKPFVAAIHGPCMGGGLEIALACAGRVASQDPSTKLALPEVNLGLLPGLGGTIRLPRLIGLQKALPMILTGKNSYARPALKMGLVDAVVPQAKLIKAAKKLGMELVEDKFHRKDKRKLVERMLDGNPFTRSIIFKKAHDQVMGKTKGNYPAPLKILEVLKFHYQNLFEDSIQYETDAFDELLQSSEARNLIWVFFAMSRFKKNPMAEKAAEVNCIGILGGGLMGQGIAEVSLDAGYRVIVKDIDEASLQKLRRSIKSTFEKRVKQKTMLPSDLETRLNRLSTTTEDEALKACDYIIEAVFEDLSLKQKIFKGLENSLSETTFLSSNTSALPIEEVGQALEDQSRLLGMHYFSPVQKMPLLEIVKTRKSSEALIATSLEIGSKQGKSMILVKDGPGFYTTRILAPFLNEALMLMEEGVPVLDIENAMKTWGFPVGPITLMDEVGIDVGAHVTTGALSKLFEKRGGQASQLLKKMNEAGFEGKKNRKGFLLYDEKSGKKKRGKINPELKKFVPKLNSKKIEAERIQQRMGWMMINEALYCLEEKIIESPDAGDLGAILGLGFPPFTGGPFHYIDQLGLDKAKEHLETLAKQEGERFTPCPLLLKRQIPFYQE